MRAKACVFDAYGTLFDVASAARQAAARPENAALSECWSDLARDWRLKQLEYSWLRAITGAHADFWTLTQDALDWAMQAQGLNDARLRADLLDLYQTLDAYPEVPAMLRSITDAGLGAAILSNGAPQMLQAAIDSSGIGAFLNAVISVEEVGVFKPARPVYALVETRLGLTPDQVLFVSSNGWDAACATGFGFTTAWVNRAGLPVDRMPWRPAHIVADLSQIPTLLEVP